MLFSVDTDTVVRFSVSVPTCLPLRGMRLPLGRTSLRSLQQTAQNTDPIPPNLIRGPPTAHANGSAAAVRRCATAGSELIDDFVRQMAGKRPDECPDRDLLTRKAPIDAARCPIAGEEGVSRSHAGDASRSISMADSPRALAVLAAREMTEDEEERREPFACWEPWREAREAFAGDGAASSPSSSL